MAPFWDDIKKRLLGSSPDAASGSTPVTGPDGFPLPAGDPLSAEHELISRYLGDEKQIIFQVPLEVGGTPVSDEIRALDAAASTRVARSLIQRLEHVEACASRLREKRNERDFRDAELARVLEPAGWRLAELLRFLLERPLELDARDLEQLLSWIASGPSLPSQQPLAPLLAMVERLARAGPLPEGLAGALGRLRARLEEHSGHTESRKHARRAAAMLGTGPQLPVVPGEVWADAALAFLEGIEASRRDAWIALLAHAEAAPGAKPSAKWRKEAERRIDAVGRDELKARLLEWFPLVEKARPEGAGGRIVGHPLAIWPPHADVLRALAWCAGFEEDRDLARALTSLAATCFKKIPGTGPRAVKIGNAAVLALGAMPGREGVEQLAVLRSRVKVRTAQNTIEKALVAAAERAGLTTEDLEESMAPTYGLTEVGRRFVPLGADAEAEGEGDDAERAGDAVGPGAELIADGPRRVRLEWIGPDGRRRASAPAALKREHPEEVRELARTQKDIQTMLAAQAERIERLVLSRGPVRGGWPLGVFRERYLDHPLVGVIARRLIWSFHAPDDGPADARAGLFHDGAFRDADGRAFEPPAKSTVSLWHPLDSLTDEIVAWRERLEALEVRQPFKQAYRELYLLTGAERATRAYSNRFAAHVLRQHQFNSLCAARGWRNQLRLLVDAEYPAPSLELPRWGLRAELWIEGAGTDWGSDTNDAGVFHHVVTDQVRFYRLDARRLSTHATGGGYREVYREGHTPPVPLEEVPALVFSEVLRDVDLFVGVASVGNDPTWSDGGPGGSYRDYWHEYAFGELSASASTRRAALERLLPRLKIAPRCSLAERFLVVRGDLRTYKIHLGSGNILMEPDDQYLCIVKSMAPAAPVDDGSAKGTGKKAGGSRVFLPFEGDDRLALILSKAFLLADDGKIKDETILQQIRRR